MDKIIICFKTTKIYKRIRYYFKYKVSKTSINRTKHYYSNNPLNIEQWHLTVDRIIDERLSLARFGDGEYACMTGFMHKKRSGLNYCDKLIRDRLITVFKSNLRYLIIGIYPCPSAPYEYYDEKNQYYYNEYVYSLRFKKLRLLLDAQRLYADATIFLKPMRTNKELNSEYFDKIKTIWSKRKVCFVSSKLGRLDVSHYLFDNLSAFDFIDIPQENAFSTYDDILSKCLTKNIETLFLLSAGFTATLLAFDLATFGYQAIDIGHITYGLN